MVPKFQFFINILIVATTGSGNPLIATNKLSLATWGSYYQRDHMGPGTYAFGYDIEDPVTGNVQFKQEERHPNGTVTGNYGYVDADGKPHVVSYVSDENGYRAKVELEGEPPKYYPDKPTFDGNVLQQTVDYPSSGSNHLKVIEGSNGEPQLKLSHPPVPVIYRLAFPSNSAHVKGLGISK